MTDKKKSTDLTPSAAAVPAILGTRELGLGHEQETDQGDIEIPRAKLIQATSDEATSNDAIKAGAVINNLTKEILPQVFTPILMFKNYIQWNPRKKDDPNYDPAFEPGDLIFNTPNRHDPRVIEGIKFGPNGEPPKVTQYMNFLCYFVDHKMPLILSFSKSSYPAGVRLNSLTKFYGGHMFSNKFKLSVAQRDGATGKFFVLEVAPIGVTTDEEAAIGKAWYEKFKGATIKVDPEKPDETHSQS